MNSIEEMRKGLECLYLVVDASIADDLTNRFEAVLQSQQLEDIKILNRKLSESNLVLYRLKSSLEFIKLTQRQAKFYLQAEAILKDNYEIAHILRESEKPQSQQPEIPIEWEKKFAELKAAHVMEVQGFLELNRKLGEEIAELNKKGNGSDGWISVEDRLPEAQGLVLLWHKSQITYAIGYYSDKRFYFSHMYLYADGDKPPGMGNSYVIRDVNPQDVTHWQPLPSPPKK